MITKNSPAYRIRYIINIFSAHSVLIIGALISILPVYWVVKSSFTPLPRIFNFPPNLIPIDFTIDNYPALFNQGPFFRNILNSLFVALLYTGANIFLSSLVGFGFAKYRKAPGARILFIIMLASIMVPFQTLAISLFVYISKLHWVNTYQGLVIPLIANGFSGFLMTQFMESMPDEIIDAARIDGCNDIHAFFAVVLPVMRPALGAIAILAFVRSWNSFFWPLILLSKEEMYTVPVVLGSFIVQQAIVPYNIIATGVTVVTVPMILLFMLAQKQFITGLTMGAGK